MKKLSFLTSMVALTFAVPAMAVPSNTSSTFPSNGVMAEDYTYQNQATVTNLKVSSGTATTTANYANCPTEFPNSDEGATSTDECYTACTVSDFPANSHIASVTGKNYSGANVTDTCAIASCDTGYTLTNHVVYPQGTPNLTEIIGNTAGTAYGYIDHSGTYDNGDGSTSQATYGISAPDTFGVDYGTGKGRITGRGLCSTQVGDNQDYTWTNPTTNATMTPEFGTEGATYCYCAIDSYTSPSGASQSLSAPWVFHYEAGSAPSCASGCALGCASPLWYDYDNSTLPFRAAVFNSVTPSAPSCDANEISITWADADAADITANNAGTVTYGGDIRTPKKAVHKPGKIFTGWTFNTPSGN